MADKRPAARANEIVMGKVLAALNAAASSKALDRFNLRKPLEHGVFTTTKSGFRTAGAVSRKFAAKKSSGSATRPSSASSRGVFDLTPTEDQQMIRDITVEFAAEQVRPAAADADNECAPPAAMLKRVASELGVNVVGIPEKPRRHGQRAVHHDRRAGRRGAGARRHGPRRRGAGARPPSAPRSCCGAMPTSRPPTCPSFVGGRRPGRRAGRRRAAPAVRPVRPAHHGPPHRRRLRPRRREVAGAAWPPTPSCSSSPPTSTAPDRRCSWSSPRPPAWSSRPSRRWASGPPRSARLLLDDVNVPAAALLGRAARPRTTPTASASRRIGWAALAVGTAQAVLDYVIPYVNEREAFGEPISTPPVRRVHGRRHRHRAGGHAPAHLPGGRPGPSRARTSPARPRSPVGWPPTTA